jgi:hypothetical protein
MENIFNATDRAALQQRVDRLQPTSTRQWGTMNAAQMLAHCASALEMACGDRPGKQVFLGKLVTPFIRSAVLGPKPLRRNTPTDPDLVIAEERDFDAERHRLSALVDRFCQAGPDAAGRQIHSFFGRFSGEEWGRLTYKHLDHHLRQFGA